MEADHNQTLEEKHSDNEADLNILREENDAKMKELTLKYESKQESTNQEYQKELEELRTKLDEKTRLKFLELYVNDDSCKITYRSKGGETEITIEKNHTKNTIDGHTAMHTMYTPQAVDKRRMLIRGETIDYGNNFSQLEQECVVDCVTSIMEASMNDPRIGPALRKLVSTE